MNILNKFIKLLFPDRCICCDDILAEETRFGLCHKCAEKASFLLRENCCRVCSSPIEAGEKLCTACKTHIREFERNISCASYLGSIKEGILNFKFRKKPDIFRPLGEMLFSTIENEKDLPQFDVLAAVPIHKKRFEERGYNQSDLLAKYLSQKLGIYYAGSDLVKVKDTPPQSSLKGTAERMKNVKGAFNVRDKSAFLGKTVLLVDDVYTTGATISEVSRILKKSGAVAVYSVTVAMAGIKKDSEEL